MTAVKRRARSPWQSRRWVRSAAPFAVALTLILLTVIMRTLDYPGPSDEAYLSPPSAEPAGASVLRRMLTERGIEVSRHTDSEAALRAAAGGQATLFVPAPDYVWPGRLRALAAVGGNLVLVLPSRQTLDRAAIPAAVAGERWTVGVAAPGCGHPAARAAGEATVLRRQYGGQPDHPPRHRCYDGGLVSLSNRVGGQVDIVGAAEPFSNDRIHEAGNAALAVGLLSGQPRVVWLDLHGPERPPPPDEGRPDDGYSGDSDGTGDGSGYGRGSGDGNGRGDGEGGDPPSGRGDSDSDGDSGLDSDSGGEGDAADADDEEVNPLFEAFPSWMWAIAAQLLLAALLLALWRARRLGAPVPEPLPVVVRSAETVEGRARLYQRARARGPALAALRAGALRRMAPVLDIGADTPEAEVVAMVSSRSRWPSEQVRHLLYGPAPTDDAALIQWTEAIDALVRAVTGPDSGGHTPANFVKKGPQR